MVIDSSGREGIGNLTRAALRAHALSVPCPHGCGCRFARSPLDEETWSCFGCGRPLSNISPERIEAEFEAAVAARGEDRQEGADAASLHARGVTVAYLNAFTDEHDCWDWPTWRVVVEIIKPATAANRCRFADIVRESNPASVGPATVFVSHSWAAKWGVLVAAAARGCEDGARCVWVDAFAVRQWDGNEADMDFQGVVSRCRSVIVALSHEVFVEADLDHDQRYLASATRNFKEMLEQPTRAKLPLSRAWCLAEIVAGVLADRAVLVTAGLAYRSTDDVRDLQVKKEPAFAPDATWVPSRLMAVSNFGLLDMLADFTRIEFAEAGLDRDRDRILNDIESRIGFGRFNAEARVAIIGGSWDGDEGRALYALACDGNPAPLRLVASKHDHESDQARLLQTMAGAGITEAVDILIREFGYHIDDKSVPAIWAAAGMGRLDVVKYLVSEWGADPNAAAGNNSTPLANASGRGLLRIVDFLLDSGADPNKRGFRGTTALIQAATFGHPEIVRRLYQAGADTEIADATGYRALGLAAKGGHIETIALLAGQLGATIDAPNGDGRHTALHCAVVAGEARAVEALLDRGADIEACAGDGSTALMLATSQGREAVADLLLERGANLLAANASGWTSLHAAAYVGAVDVLRAIAKQITNGSIDRETVAAATKMTTTEGGTALGAAVATTQPEAIRVLVHDLGADPNQPDRSGWTPLNFALWRQAEDERRDLSAVEALLECGADVRMSDSHRRSALYACRNRASVQMLIDNPARQEILRRMINEPDDRGLTALIFAAARGDAEVIRALCDLLGANINQKGALGLTALHMAAIENAIDAGRACIDAGADLDATDSGGARPIDAARQRGHVDFEAMLIERGADPGPRTGDGYKSM